MGAEGFQALPYPGMLGAEGELADGPGDKSGSWNWKVGGQAPSLVF